MVEKTTITAQKSLLRLPDGTYVIPYTTTSGSLEIGDIGQALFIDETKGTRRILNGQLVAINENTKPFLDYLKNLQTVSPQLFVTEEAWQAEKLLSVYGQVGKFVLTENEYIQYAYNATEVGNLTKENGVVSGFSQENYFKFLNNFQPSTSNWELNFKIRTSNMVSEGQQILVAFGNGDTSETRYATRIYINNSKTFGISVTYNGTAWDINTDAGSEGSVGTYNLLPNTDYYIKFIYDGNSYQLQYSLDNETYITDINVDSSTPMFNSCTQCTLGAWISTTPTNPFLGYIDLNESYININGERWWNGVNTEVVPATIRIPAIVNMQGLLDLTNVGKRLEQSVPNHTHSGTTSSNGAHTHTRGTMDITGRFPGNTDDGSTNFAGTFYIYSTANSGANGGNGQGVIGFQASKNWTGATSSNGAHTHTMTTGGASDSNYKNGTNVQQEAIQYPYFIQIAHEQHTTTVRNEWTQINPYTLFEYKYSYSPLSNASWLISQLQQNSKDIYPTAYEALCVELNDSIQTLETVSLPSGGKYTKHLQTVYFDKSKLVINGNPSISLNGVMTYSDTEDYIKLNVSNAISNATNYTLKLRFKFASNTIIFSTSTAVTPNCLMVRCVGDKIETNISLLNEVWDYTITTEYTFIEGEWYDLKLSFNIDKGYKFEISNNLGATYNLVWTLNDFNRLTPESTYLIFGSTYNMYGTTIDLKTIQFTYDGININCNRQENLVWNKAEHSATEAGYDKKFIVDTVNETFRLPLLVDRELNNGENIYFYIGDVAQNSALVDVGRLTEQLAILKAEVEKLKG